MKKQLVLAVALAFAPFAAFAENLSHSYVEAGYAYTDIDGLGDGDGLAIGGSVAVHDNFHVFGHFSKQEADESSINVDLDTLRLGVGYNLGLNDNVEFVSRLAFERSDLDSQSRAIVADTRADGYSIEAGVRGAFGGHLESWAFAGYGRVEDVKVNNVEIDTDDLEGRNGDFYGRVGALVKFNPTWGLVAETTFNDDAQHVFGGLRASF